MNEVFDPVEQKQLVEDFPVRLQHFGRERQLQGGIAARDVQLNHRVGALLGCRLWLVLLVLLFVRQKAGDSHPVENFN